MRRTIVPVALVCLLASACDSKGKDAPSGDDAKAKADADAKADATAKAKADAKAEIAEAEKAIDAAEAKAPPEEPPKENFGGEFCATIIPCFEKMKFAGSFTADVSVDIEPDGSVSAVSFTGDAPKPVQTCINDGIKAIKLAEYNGKPGRTRCTKSGQLVGGTKMIMSDSSYEVRDAGAAEAGDAKADAKAG